ncbi:MAG: PadR family transcriptional regulator [Chloroflexi bacterium UTCFX4]|jgi:DNA-binding PadR family transcriptional regulator|nr:MAG: PadR family transcriptional regulator [Chloroflexi bacterium UTCFX4]
MSVRHAVLGLLAQRPRHGYELHAAFESVVGGAQNWDVKPAQIYTTLTRLEESGLVVENEVAQDGGPEKRIYALTPQGARALLEWFRAPVEREYPRDEFFIKLMLCLITGVANPSQVIQTQRAKLYQDLHNITVQRARANPQNELARILLFDKAIMRLEADLRWMDLAQARLDDIMRQPIPEPDLKPRGRPRKIQD